ncbi:MAG: hypothetical protein HY831_03580 [Candidatus Aenigmarchaeota archaeon]|nr:hypothetical protein [Candidatus Aenigmarchaeota archaeon]
MICKKCLKKKADPKTEMCKDCSSEVEKEEELDFDVEEDDDISFDDDGGDDD